MSNFRVNGRNIKNPSTFKIERYNVTTMNRLSNGDMTGDLVAKKLKFYFTYDSLTAKDLDIILAAIWDSDDIFFPLQYPYNGTQKTSLVYVGSIPTELARAGVSENWAWRGVNFNLIER